MNGLLGRQLLEFVPALHLADASTTGYKESDVLWPVKEKWTDPRVFDSLEVINHNQR